MNKAPLKEKRCLIVTSPVLHILNILAKASVLVWIVIYGSTVIASTGAENAIALDDKSDIPGDMSIALSTFHELRSTYKNEAVKLKVHSKMSGAYDVVLVLAFDDITLNAEFDLVNESLVLDGNGAVLTDDYKDAFIHARRHLISHLKSEFEDEYPEHSFLAVQMLGYWSSAPKDFPIGRREIHTRS